jgi:glycosyltransferase involved in cell wall biosynthesis
VKVVYFGTYERDYPRNSQVISCLRGAGVDVLEHHLPVWEGRRDKFGIGVGAISKLVGAELRLMKRLHAEFDLVMVGYPGHADMPAARRAAGRRPVVFNPLVSLEDTIVGDRGLARPRSTRARLLRAVDRQAFHGADLVVADTEAHATYFEERFGLASDQVSHCYVGAEDRLFTPGQRATTRFTLLFVGKLIPLHGIETILSAAALCPDVAFHLVGSGQLDELLAMIPANVRHEPWVAYERLPDLYRSAGCALGVFGASEKAARVIPNKAFQALATRTPLITADTRASRELLVHERDALLVAPGDPRALADAILRLESNEPLRRDLAAGGRTTYEQHAAEDVLGRRWRSLLEQLLS